jgi:phage tail sheath protein FI
MAGAFQWGPVDEVTTVESENNLVEKFGRPDDQTANYFFTAANFLSYGNNLQLIRVIDRTTARNAVSLPSGQITSVQVLSSANTFTTNTDIVVTFDSPGVTGTTAQAYAVLENTGRIVEISKALSGFGYSRTPTVTIQGGGGSGATAVATIGGGEIDTISVLAGGNNYTILSNVVIQNQDSTSARANLRLSYGITGVGITAPANVIAGLITGGYTPNATVSFIGGGGSGATANISLNYFLDGVSVIEPGTNYTDASNAYIFDGPNSEVDAYFDLILSYGISNVTVSNPGNGYDNPPEVSIIGGGGSGATARANISGSQITGIEIITAGAGYLSIPNVIITANVLDTITSNAEGTAQFNSNGQIVGVIFTPLSGTDSPPGFPLPGTPFDAGVFEGGTGNVFTAPIIAFNRNSLVSGIDANVSPIYSTTNVNIRTILITNSGSGYTSEPTVVINRNGPSGVDFAFTANLGYGTVVGIDVLNPGAGGYSFTPNIVINRNNLLGGANAAAEAKISALVDTITITNPGSGYTSAPNVIITRSANDTQVSSNAAAVAVVGYEVDSIVVTNPGTDYRTVPSVTVQNTLGVNASVIASLSFGSTLITNADNYEASHSVGGYGYGEFAAKYPGTLGNAIRVSVADANTYSSWQYANQFDSAPGTSAFVSSRGGSNDEMHIVVIDATSEWSGTAGTILEKFSFVSKASDAKNSDGSSNYYKTVISNQSKYIWVLDHPTSTSNWGTVSASKSFDQLSANITTTLAAGANGNEVSSANVTTGYAVFANDELYDISLIPMGPVTNVGTVNAVIAIAETRRDAMVFVSPPYADVVNTTNQATKITDYRNSLTSSSYAVIDSGWKYQYDRYNDKYRYVPLNGDIAGLAARTDYVADPWFSPAGYNRGVIKNVVKLAYSPSKTDRDTLYKKGVNPVVTFPGQGTLLFGDKTLLARPSAFDRINVRRLFIVLEKAIATASKFQLFEFNDAFTRAQFRNLIEPFLRDVQGRRGITDFRVICDETNNTAEIIDRNEFVADIFIKPARAINFIQLNFIATRSGVSFEEVGA